MTDLISRDNLLADLRAGKQRCIDASATYGDKNPLDEDDWERWANDYDDMIGLVKCQPRVTPQIVANISGGVLQGASATHKVELYTLDFDLDTFDEDARGILVEGDMAYLSQVVPKIDLGFVEQVIDAPERLIHNEALVCGQCEGTGETQSASNALELEVCPVCDGSGTL